MDIKSIGGLLERLVPPRVRQAAWMRPKYPLVGLELRGDAVVAARVARKGKAFRLAGHAERALAPGVFSASLLKTEIGDSGALVRAITEALQASGAVGAGRISLTLPDTVARVFLVDLDELPLLHQQAAELIRWRIKKSIPFRPEDARLAWQELGKAEDGKTHVLVTVAPDAGIRPIEDLFDALGLRVGLVDLATFNVFNLLRLAHTWNGTEAIVDRALLNATPTYFSLMILRGERLILYRSKAYHTHGGFQGEESMRVVGRELRSTLSYYEEHLLGGAIAATFVRSAGIPAEELLEVVRGAGLGEVREAAAERVLPEMQGMADGVSRSLMPAAGLALRRLA